MVRIYDLQAALPLTQARNIAAGHLVRSDHQWNRHGWQKSLWHLRWRPVNASCNCELRVVWLDQNKIQLLMTQYGYHMLSHRCLWDMSEQNHTPHDWQSFLQRDQKWSKCCCAGMSEQAMWIDVGVVEHAKTMTQASLQPVAWPV